MTRDEALTLLHGEMVSFTDDSCEWLGYAEGQPIAVHHIEPVNHHVKIWLDLGAEGIRYSLEGRMQRCVATVHGHVNDLLQAFTQ